MLVPSDHIAQRLVFSGRPRDQIEIVPYAADCKTFQPIAQKAYQKEKCTFLFAGGICQRKGVKYLLEAWRRVKRPGWRLQLLGALPLDPGPLEPYRDDFEWLGRAGRTEMPKHLASADVFVFPSLFEGSAVVAYEALACGLPVVTTPNSGSVVRDGIEGFIVPSRAIEPLADRLERLGTDAELRRAMSAAARARALEFDWPRYHDSIAETVRSLLSDVRPRLCPSTAMELSGAPI